jgi:gamma-glutamyl-gamma-aminobutyrate hydrolase PuuD
VTAAPRTAAGAAGVAAPVVGLTAYGTRARWGGVWDTETVLLTRTYVDMVVAAGGVPVLLPPVPAAAGAVDRLDAVVLSGGPDVAPEHYGAAPHPRAGPPHGERDALELAVLERALARGVPVLGVCRGAQLLNVALGGTLVQHLSGSGVDHRSSVHDVLVTEGSRLHRVVGSPSVPVSSYHHQAIDVLAPDLQVVARAEDGVVEAVEHRTADVLGVQWHPEDLHRTSPTDAALFADLVDRAARHRLVLEGAVA